MNRRTQQAVENLIAVRRTYRADFPSPGSALLLTMIHAEDELANAIDEEAMGGRSET